MSAAEHHSKEQSVQVKSVVVPILMTTLAYFLYSLGDAGSKELLKSLYFMQVMLVSGAVSVVLMVIYGSWKDGKKMFRTNKPKLMILRAVLGQLSGICILLALKHISLTVFYTLIFTSPFWVALLSILFLKEKPDRRRIGVILFGFAVVLYIFRPGSGLFNIWSLVVLVGAVFYAMQLLVIRRIGASESRALIVLYGSVMRILIAVPFMGNHYLPLTGQDWLIFGVIGLTGCVGLMFISYAFQEAASPAVVAPCQYTQIIWGALLGYCFFHDVPGVETLAVAALLILSGLYLIRHERRRPVLKVGA